MEVGAGHGHNFRNLGRKKNQYWFKCTVEHLQPSAGMHSPASVGVLWVVSPLRGRPDQHSLQLIYLLLILIPHNLSSKMQKYPPEVMFKLFFSPHLYLFIAAFFPRKVTTACHGDFIRLNDWQTICQYVLNSDILHFQVLLWGWHLSIATAEQRVWDWVEPLTAWAMAFSRSCVVFPLYSWIES